VNCAPLKVSVADEEARAVLDSSKVVPLVIEAMVVPLGRRPAVLLVTEAPACRPLVETTVTVVLPDASELVIVTATITFERVICEGESMEAITVPA